MNPDQNKIQNKIKVLIADDEPSLRTLLRAVISSEDIYELDEAEDGDQVLAKIKINKPDILILDVMMPGQSGFEVCEKIKKNEDYKGMKIIILTAKGQNSDSDWAKSVGADYFFKKPFSPLELLELLKKLQ